MWQTTLCFPNFSTNMIEDYGHWEPKEEWGGNAPPLGFIYLITRKSDGKFYIGKKHCWQTRRKPPLKGKIRKRVIKSESDWRTYRSSSGWLQEDIARLGEDAFTFKILKWCESEWELTYWEAYW